MKKCSYCQIVKSYEDFHKNASQKDGYHQTCKLCRKIEDKIRFDKFMKKEDFVVKERKRGRKKYHKFKYKSKNTFEKRLQYKNKYPEKYKAKIAISSLKKEKGFEYHHWSYNEEHFKDLIKLTVKEHKKAHRFIIYEQNLKMYITCKEKILLDTKEKHEEYIKKCIFEEED